MEEWVRVLSALLTPAIAIVTTFIAIQQYRLAKFKMRHELFQRRLEVYKALVEYLTAVVRPTPPADQSAVKMIRETADGRFLFKEEIAEYLMDLYKKGIELWALNEELSDPDINSEDRRHKVTERGRLKIWFADQYGVAEGKFKKYLALTLED